MSTVIRIFCRERKKGIKFVNCDTHEAQTIPAWLS